MADLNPIVWTKTKLQGGGERRIARDEGNGEKLATVVQLPGSVARIYWNDGTMLDQPSLNEAELLVEARFS